VNVPSDGVDQVPELVRRLYGIVSELETLFPGRHFTPDGHLVGSIGESLAAHLFGLTLTTASNRGFDAETADGLRVEIKTTQRDSIALSSSPEPHPDRLVVLRLLGDGSFEVIYNGPAEPVWEIAGRPQRNGQRRVGLTSLGQIPVAVGDRLPLVRVVD
jgi:hypothetical protein